MCSFIRDAHPLLTGSSLSKAGNYILLSWPWRRLAERWLREAAWSGGGGGGGGEGPVHCLQLAVTVWKALKEAQEQVHL